MKRFYDRAEAAPQPEGWGVLLDGRPVRTPMRTPLSLPTQDLAEAIAAEWAGQPEQVRPLNMPLTRLAATALDRVRPQRDGVVDEIAGFGRTDLLCYRASEPRELVQRQAATWQPLLDWLRRRFDVHLATTEGVMAVAQDEAALTRLRGIVASLDDFALVGLHALTTSAGSLVVGLAVLEGEIDADAGFRAGQLDELFQAELWGSDAEAVARRAALAEDMLAAAKFLELARKA